MIKLPSNDTTQMSVHVVTNLQEKETEKLATPVQTETVINTLKNDDVVMDMVSRKENLIILETPVESSTQAIGDINVAMKAQKSAAGYNGLVNDGIMMTIVSLVTQDDALAAKQAEVAATPILDHAHVTVGLSDEGAHVLNIAIDNKAMTNNHILGVVQPPSAIAMMISNMMGNEEKCDATLAKHAHLTA